MYSIKETYYTIQGEGFHTGRPAVFLRFSGCNLWTGLEADRSNAICNFCDTDFVGVNGPGGGKFEKALSLAKHAISFWPKNSNSKPFVVCTGGEPLLQVDQAFVDAFHKIGFQIAIETNGTVNAPKGIDWICVSPKIGSKLILKKGHELKLVYPQLNGDPKQFEYLDFEHFSLQPMDGKEKSFNIKETISFCREHPLWRLSFQTHKFLGIP